MNFLLFSLFCLIFKHFRPSYDTVGSLLRPPSGPGPLVENRCLKYFHTIVFLPSQCTFFHKSSTFSLLLKKAVHMFNTIGCA